MTHTVLRFLRGAAVPLFLVISDRMAIAAAPPALPDLLQDYQSLLPASNGVPLLGASLRVGHLQLDFESGALFPLSTPTGVELGFFFHGTGHYAYTSADPGDQKALALNLSRHARAPQVQASVVGDGFKSMLLLCGTEEGLQACRPRPAKEDSPAAAAPAARLTPEEISTFHRLWGQVRQTYLPWDHLAAETRFNAPGDRYVYAEIAGDVQTVGYVYDPVRRFEERLFLYQNLPALDIRIEDPLSYQRLENSIPHPIDLILKDVQIQVTTEDNHKVRIASDLTLQAGRDHLQLARLSLMNNRNPHSYDWASPRNQLRVLKVEDDTGRALPFSHKYHEILVRLPRPLSRGDFLNLKFETEGEVITGLFGEDYSSYFSLFMEPWFPNPFGWGEAGFTFHLKARTHKPYLPVASGDTVTLHDLPESYELEADGNRPVKWVALFAGKYDSREQTFDDAVIRVHAYSSGRKDVLARMPEVAHQFIRFYRGILGAPASRDLDIVEIPEFLSDEGYRSAFGIAPPGMVLMTSEAYRARDDFALQYFSRGVNARLAHEIAHQWFPHKAMPASPRDSWLSESFAEYLAGMAMAAASADESRVVGYGQMLAGWQSSAKLCASSGSLETADSLGGESGWMNRNCLLYDRGPLVLRMLHTMIGHDRFYSSLRLLLERAHGGLVSTDDFRKVVEETVQADFGWFFEDWVTRGGIPTVRVEKQVVPAGAEGFALTGRISQDPGDGFRRVLVPLVVDYGTTRREVKLVFQDKPLVEFRFLLPSMPTEVQVDPSHNNLVTYR